MVLLNLALFAFSAFAHGSVETLPRTVIEGIAPPPPLEESSAPSAAVPVTSGQGAVNLETPVNELGVELENMEHFEEISLARRAEPWWLRARAPRDSWLNQFHLDLSRDQKFKARTLGRVADQPMEFEGGWFTDHRDLVLLENPNVANRNDRRYLTSRWHGSRQQVLLEVDEKMEDIHAGAFWSGVKTSRSQSLSGEWNLHPLRLKPFVQFRQYDFSSQVAPLYSNFTSGQRAGLQANAQSPDRKSTVQSTLSYESLDRRWSEEVHSHFERHEEALRAQHAETFQEVELTLEAGLVSASDQTVWSAGTEVSSTRTRAWGLVGRLKRFSWLPTPSQRFGDGALLAGNESLTPETGLRTSIGPWWRTENYEAELSVFSEREKNVPVMVAVSPTSASTQAVGGVWAQGLELRQSLHLGRWSWNALYSNQNAVNDSTVSWQRGHAVPGRPRHVVSSGLEYRSGHWRGGGDYGYRSEQAMDLVGLWTRPPHHDLNVYVGYAERDWEVRAVGAKLLSNANRPPSAQFEGQAAPDLIEPTIEQMEIRLICEFTM